MEVKDRCCGNCGNCEIITEKTGKCDDKYVDVSIELDDEDAIFPAIVRLTDCCREGWKPIE